MCHEEIDAAFVHHLTPGPISVAYHENHKGAVGVVSAASDRRVWMFIIRLMVKIVLRLYLNPLSCNVAVMLIKKATGFIFLPVFFFLKHPKGTENLASVTVEGLCMIIQSERHDYQTCLTFLIRASSPAVANESRPGS